MATFRFVCLDLGREGEVLGTVDAQDDVEAFEAFAFSPAAEGACAMRTEELVRGRWGEPLAAFACRMGHPAYG